MVQRAANDGERRCLNPRTAIRAGLNTAPPKATAAIKGARRAQKKSVIFIRVNHASRRGFKNASARQFEEAKNTLAKPRRKQRSVCQRYLLREQSQDSAVLVELELPLRKLSE